MKLIIMILYIVEECPVFHTTSQHSQNGRSKVAGELGGGWLGLIGRCELESVSLFNWLHVLKRRRVSNDFM